MHAYTNAMLLKFTIYKIVQLDPKIIKFCVPAIILRCPLRYIRGGTAWCKCHRDLWSPFAQSQFTIQPPAPSTRGKNIAASTSSYKSTTAVRTPVQNKRITSQYLHVVECSFYLETKVRTILQPRKQPRFWCVLGNVVIFDWNCCCQQKYGQRGSSSRNSTACTTVHAWRPLTGHWHASKFSWTL